MTDTKTPPSPTTGCAPLGRPMAETVSLEMVWAAAYAAHRIAYPDGTTESDVKSADGAVTDLLAAHPRGGR